MPYLNMDDEFADHPKVDALSHGAFRLHVSGETLDRAAARLNLTPGALEKFISGRTDLTSAFSRNQKRATYA